MLKLVQTAEIVQLPVKEPSTFDQAWTARQGMMKKRGDGSDKTRKLWERAAKKVGSARLLEALKRYLREEKEPTCGYPGLSVWLNGERYDHWLAQISSGSPDGAVFLRAQTPEPLRTMALSVLEESFVRSYLDPCTFHEDGWITPATEFARKKLWEERAKLAAAGVAGVRRRE